MNYLFVLLLTALLTTNVLAVPTYRRRNENATMLELIAQYKQYKLQAVQAGELKAKLLEQAKSKQLAIESKIGFTSNSTSSLGAAKSGSTGSVEPFTILTATGSAIVFESHGTTSTVTLNLTTTATTNPGTTSSSSTTPSPAPTTPPSTTEPVTVLTATGSVIVLASQGTTQTVTLNATTTTAPSPTTMPT